MASVVTSDIVLEDIDLGYEEMRRRLTRTGGVRIETGLFGKVAKKGAWAEFGSKNAPARPWLSVAADHGKNKLASSMADAVDDIAGGAAPKTAMDEVGDDAAKLARDMLGSASVGGPALAPATVAHKGSSAKLVETGAMKRAVRSKVKVRR
jgi:hypothetical protein